MPQSTVTIHPGAWKEYSVNFAGTEFYEVRPRKKCPPGICIARFRVSSMVQVRSGAPAPRKGKPVARRGRKAQGPPFSLGEVAGLPNWGGGMTEKAAKRGPPPPT
jgi:hypothetical protein